MSHFLLGAEGNFVSFCSPLVKVDIVWRHMNLRLSETTDKLFFHRSILSWQLANIKAKIF